MKLKSNQPKATAEQVVKDIRRATSRTKVMSSSKLQRRAKANVVSKSTLVIWGATETLQYKSPPYRVSKTMGVIGGGREVRKLSGETV